MEIIALSPVGARVTDLDIAAADERDGSALRTVLAMHGVVVLPGQRVNDDNFQAFLERFGELMFTAGEKPLEGFPDLNVISNVGRTTPPRSTFHVDTSYVRRPPAYTALRAVLIPQAGGQTLFTNQYRAYDTLDPELRQRLDGRTIRHVVTGVELTDDDERDAEHPVFRTHPISGRTAVYMSTPKRCVAISGIDDGEAAELIGRLFDHCTQEDNVYRHQWAAGDVVVWDNRCVLHKADHDGVVGDRVMHRGMVADDGYPCPA